MKYKVTFSDGRIIAWEGQDLDTVNTLATNLANGTTFVVEQQ